MTQPMTEDDLSAIEGRWNDEQAAVNRASVVKVYHARRIALQGLSDVPSLLAEVRRLRAAEREPKVKKRRHNWTIDGNGGWICRTCRKNYARGIGACEPTPETPEEPQP